MCLDLSLELRRRQSMANWFKVLSFLSFLQAPSGQNWACEGIQSTKSTSDFVLYSYPALVWLESEMML